MDVNQEVLPVKESLMEAWHQVNGSKASFWAAIGILFAIGFVISTFQGLTDWKGISLAKQGIGILLQAGIVYIGIKRAMDEPISYRMIWRSFEGDLILRIISLYLVEILIFLPFIFLTVIGFLEFWWNIFLALGIFIIGICALVYLGLSIILATAYVIDKKYGPIQAIKMSFKATRKHLVNLLLIMLAELLIIVVASIPIGIGLIWAIPFCLNCYGVIYRKLSVQLEMESSSH